jgi:hypothetical protein
MRGSRSFGKDRVTIVHKSVRDNSQLGAWPIYVSNFCTHTIESSKRILLRFVRKSTKHFTNVVWRFEWKSWETHPDRLVSLDLVVNLA